MRTGAVRRNPSSLELRSEEAHLRKQLMEQTNTLQQLMRDHRELSFRYRHLQKELERAGKVQRSLLPDRMPTLDGYRFASLYRPCESVGGDFYDFLEGDHGTVFLVADVVGHGLESALTTMLLKWIFHETADHQSEPNELLSRMNSRLQRLIPADMFAVALIITVSPRAAVVQLSNAGLPYPFVLRSSDNRVDEVSLAGFPLGLFDPVHYESQVITLEPGDVLLVSTDGIRSISNVDDEHFETNQLTRTLNELVGQDGEKVIEGLMGKALTYGNGNPLPDDINLVAVTRSRG